MIVVKLQGGLGNQMFQYAFGRNLSLVNKVELALDAQALRNGEGITRRHYALEAFRIEPKLLNEEESEKYRGELTPIKEDARAVKDQLSSFPKNNCYFEGYWQSEEYFSTNAETIRQDFALRLPLSEKAEKMKQEIEAEPCIALQVRRSDYVSNRKVADILGACSKEYYSSAIKTITNRIGPVRIFVVSDDITWCINNLSFSQRTVYISAYRLPDHEDMYLMSLADHSVISNSSFGWWGAWLNANPKKIVIAPKQWFRNPVMNARNPISKSWTQI